MEEKSIIQKAQELTNQKNYQEAIEYFEKALEADPGRESTYLRLSSCYRSLNDLKKSMKFLDRLLKMKPKYVIAMIEKSDILLEQNSFAEAEKMIDQCIKLNPNFIKSYCLKGKLIINKKKYGKALNYFNKAIALNENYFDSFFGHGIALSYLGYCSEALSSFDKAADIYEKGTLGIAQILTEADYSKVFYFKAKMLNCIKEHKEALQSIDQALEHMEEYIKENEAFLNSDDNGNNFNGSQDESSENNTIPPLEEEEEKDTKENLNDSCIYDFNRNNELFIRKVYLQLKEKIQRDADNAENPNRTKRDNDSQNASFITDREEKIRKKLLNSKSKMADEGHKEEMKINDEPVNKNLSNQSSLNSKIIFSNDTTNNDKSGYQDLHTRNPKDINRQDSNLLNINKLKKGDTLNKADTISTIPKNFGNKSDSPGKVSTFKKEKTIDRYSNSKGKNEAKSSNPPKTNSIKPIPLPNLNSNSNEQKNFFVTGENIKNESPPKSKEYSSNLLKVENKNYSRTASKLTSNSREHKSINYVEKLAELKSSLQPKNADSNAKANEDTAEKVNKNYITQGTNKSKKNVSFDKSSTLNSKAIKKLTEDLKGNPKDLSNPDGKSTDRMENSKNQEEESKSKISSNNVLLKNENKVASGESKVTKTLKNTKNMNLASPSRSSVNTNKNSKNPSVASPAKPAADINKNIKKINSLVSPAKPPANTNTRNMNLTSPYKAATDLKKNIHTNGSSNTTQRKDAPKTTQNKPPLPPKVSEAEKLAEEGKKLAKENKKDKALELFNKAIKLEPKNAELYKLKANCLKLSNNKKESLAAYKKAYELSNNKNDDILLLLNIANLNNALGNFEESIRYYDAVLDINPKSDLALTGKAICLYQNNKTKEALEVYDKYMLEVNMKNLNVIYNRSICLFELEKYKEALKSYKYYTTLNDKNYTVYLNMAECAEELSDKENAIKYYDKALSLIQNDDKTKVEILYKKAYSLFENNKLEDAETIFKQCLDVDKNYSKAICGIGLCLNKKGKYKESIDYYNQALELDKNNPIFSLYKCFALFDSKDTTEGKKCIEETEKILSLYENGKDENFDKDVVNEIKSKIKTLKKAQGL
ncbi:MAG: tetratricopeptide repeat protein [archaeon]|nr:tetratricopeptide repeat protein [archaeon]